MIQDYPQFIQADSQGGKLTHTWQNKLVIVIEFLLILVMLQAILSIFQTHDREEPVRYRILAHSNSQRDQEVKLRIQQEIEPMLAKAVASANTEEALDRELASLEKQMLAAANQIAPNETITLERKSALFPAKRTGFWITPQDEYDAYVLTIGSGRGSNWWCSIFPKVCYEEESEEPVKFFVWEWITSLFSK